MSLSGEGDNAPAVEVTNISSHGIWLYAQGKEMFMSYEDFPWFEEAAVSKILNVEEASTRHFYWLSWMWIWGLIRLKIQRSIH